MSVRSTLFLRIQHRSRMFIPTAYEVPRSSKSKSQKLLQDTGYVHNVEAGLPCLLPLGKRVLLKMETLIRNEMNSVGGQELFLSAIGKKNIWEKSDRWHLMNTELFKFKDGADDEYCLSPEAITRLVSTVCKTLPQTSYPLLLYQITWKYRNEMHFRHGLLRTKEFLMKDLYSFHLNEENAKKIYDDICSAYERIFKQLNVPFIKVAANSGMMGGTINHEYLTPCDIGEDTILLCSKYTKLFDAIISGTESSTTDTNDQINYLTMGCYGIGLTRLMATIVELSKHSEQIRWPKAILPYKVVLIPPKKGSNEEPLVNDKISELLETVESKDEWFIDDRTQFSIGQRLIESKKMGIPIVIIFGKRAVEKGLYETYMSLPKISIPYTAAAVGGVALAYYGTRAYRSKIEKLYDDGIDLEHQTVEIDPVEKIRRCTFYKNDDIYSEYKKIYPDVKSLADMLYHGHLISNNGPCIGIIEVDEKQKNSPLDPSTPIQWLPYSRVLENVRCIGSYLLDSGVIPNESKVGIMSLNRPEWAYVEHACYMYSFIVVSLYTTYDSQTLLKLLKRTQTDVLVVDNLDRVKSIMNELFQNGVKLIISMDQINSLQTNIQSLDHVMTEGKKNIRSCHKPDPDSIASFIFTSGTTGEPKIAMLSHANILATIKASIDRRRRANLESTCEDRHCSFLPMAHLYERLILCDAFLQGSQVAFCPQPEKLFEYYQVIKPTRICMVPRILNKVYDAIYAEVNKSKVKRFLIQQALNNDKPTFLSKIIFRKVKRLFGNHVYTMLTGSAPITPDVLHFFRIALNIPIVEGYGQTESSGAGSVMHVTDLTAGTVGTPFPCLELKLVDVEGTNYRKDNNQGEVCLRGPVVFKGYYGDDAKTRETIDEDGWLHTGDIGEWTINGTLRIIDRCKHIFKLNQGEYIAPERLEEIYIRSPWIAQVYVDGKSTESHCVAVVIPDEEYVKRTFDKDKSFDDLCLNDAKLKQTILNDLQRLAKEHKLKYYESIKNIHLHPHLFSQGDGFITDTFKTRRQAVRKHFQNVIDQLYSNQVKSIKPIELSKL
ncbi:unnamed protein product [Didymodactylos carnosus]|uniref:long-chain-fatty-acid--CoA ligase n=1 Tax=Didymodactylos carnosus TaxID=1234261 RepID=A0A813RQF2_9BILA|nr:unnamed protein product [Didymodactylos carnosus]CAF0784540.1 unnamed protein product [Didymodactylos carnosus]CAF3545464.1 unnamed protein product [Didymodactylos carnosus]CAF3568143.1 unnamed protein product [Didymodactylos carnosus]